MLAARLFSKNESEQIFSSLIIFHIGAPRTASTTLQKHIFPLCKHALYYHKKPRQRSEFYSVQGEAYPSIASRVDLERFSTEGLLDLLMACAFKLAIHHEDARLEASVGAVFKTLIQDLQSDVLISNERLCDTSSSLCGEPTHLANSDRILPCLAITRALQRAGFQACISVCLREPISYLRSKYLRTALQRKAMNLNAITPSQFIRNQIHLEDSSANSSALWPAFHIRFIKELGKNAIVNHFGFSQLMQSQDCLALAGVKGETPYPFPLSLRENSIDIGPAEKNEIEREIILALDNYSLHARILDNRIYI